ncbi:MHYT domain-containing protein [Pseudooceanicola onchidii]|uniref:MHYT domain-containing protein n=1 Tax=Pseudooceanicola onchidii TaxID=2562279 RepID=UPI00145BCD44|nr:MHYT domain-containing protein [Pseudooceanicola onchidii]
MIGLLLQGILETKVNFIAAAGAVCLLTAVTLALLTRNLQRATAAQRRYAAFWVAVVSGVGVWTTHFVAMIGYRPDAALTYDFQLTGISILVGILAVGLPVAGSVFFSDTKIRLGLGVIAGFGVAAMHLTGMSAIENCLATYNPFVLLLGIIAGVLGFVVALMQDPTDPTRNLQRVLGFVGGVCSLHFVAMAAVSLERLNGTEPGIGGSFLSIMVAVVSLGVLSASVVATFNHRRHLAQQSLMA